MVTTNDDDRRRRILVVDDEKTVAFLLGESLQVADPGWEVTAVSTMKEALAALVRQPFDLLISDLRMPSVSGLELLGHVQETWPQTRLFLITAYGSEDVVEDVRRLQIAGYMTKPFDMDEFIASIRLILNA
jgi:two-component system, NtrC family, response regulator PilR